MNSNHLLARITCLSRSIIIGVSGVDEPLDSWYQVFGKVSATSWEESRGSSLLWVDICQENQWAPERQYLGSNKCEPWETVMAVGVSESSRLHSHEILFQFYLSCGTCFFWVQHFYSATSRLVLRCGGQPVMCLQEACGRSLLSWTTTFDVDDGSHWNISGQWRPYDSCISWRTLPRYSQKLSL